MSEFDEDRTRILVKTIIGHYNWLVQNEICLIRICEWLIGKIDLSTPPDIVRQICLGFLKIQSMQRLFNTDFFKLHGYSAQLLLRTISLILSGERELILDDLIELNFVCNSVDWSFFFETTLPFIQSSIADIALARMASERFRDRSVFEEVLLTLNL